MSRARHNLKGGTKMSGGKAVKDPVPALSMGNKDVSSAALVARKDGGEVEGKMSKMNLGRPGRKRGGRVGADKSPLSAAASTEGRSSAAATGGTGC